MAVDYSLIRKAFETWADFIRVNENTDSPQYHIPSGMQGAFQEIALTSELSIVYGIGCEYGFSGASITNILILHGGYFRLLHQGLIRMSAARYIDSLYHHSFPSLRYCLKNKEVLAPWVTFGAQEALLDMSLSETSVIEYGSGMSTFFFLNEAFECVSFESDVGPDGDGGWSRQMMDMAQREKVDVRLVVPDGRNDRPVESLGLVSGSKVLVFVDGEDRGRHLDEWSEYILENRSQNIVLLVDNSELGDFRDSFELLHRHGAFINHHYGPVYGQLTFKQCTSLVTLNPLLLVAKSPSPSTHDKRWGQMNFQP